MEIMIQTFEMSEICISKSICECRDFSVAPVVMK